MAKKDTIFAVFPKVDGLSTSEATKRIIKYGENRLEFRSKPIWKIILEPFSNIFVIIACTWLLLNKHNNNNHYYYYTRSK